MMDIEIKWTRIKDRLANWLTDGELFKRRRMGDEAYKRSLEKALWDVCMSATERRADETDPVTDLLTVQAYQDDARALVAKEKARCDGVVHGRI